MKTGRSLRQLDSGVPLRGDGSWAYVATCFRGAVCWLNVHSMSARVENGLLKGSGLFGEADDDAAVVLA
jgi:hypothetical protein